MYIEPKTTRHAEIPSIHLSQGLSLVLCQSKAKLPVTTHNAQIEKSPSRG